MEFEKVLAFRQSTRSFTEEKVSEKELTMIMNVASRAPIGMHNYQGYSLMTITNEAVLNAMIFSYQKLTGTDKNPLYKAPAFILLCANEHSIERLVQQDAGAIISFMNLKVSELGLGSVYIFGMIHTILADDSWKKLANISSGYVPIAGLAVGHSKNPIRERPWVSYLTTSFIK